jgi:hypothetical protein
MWQGLGKITLTFFINVMYHFTFNRVLYTFPWYLLIYNSLYLKPCSSKVIWFTGKLLYQEILTTILIEFRISLKLLWTFGKDVKLAVSYFSNCLRVVAPSCRCFLELRQKRFTTRIPAATPVKMLAIRSGLNPDADVFWNYAKNVLQRDVFRLGFVIQILFQSSWKRNIKDSIFQKNAITKR